MPKFSIIVACYNSFDKMNKCLECLENQTFKDFETIFIDDCSTDDSYLKLDEYLNNSKLNFKLLQNEKNVGAGLTRNKGIENATGKYLTFLDSDDYFEENALEVINSIIEKEKVDCVLFDYCYKTKKNNIYYKTVLGESEGIISKSNALIYSTGSTWCKVYLLENIKKYKIEFPNLKRNEDFVFNKIAIANSDSFYYLEKTLYNYVEYHSSLMNNKELSTEENAIKGFEMIEKKLKDSFPKEVEALFIKEYFYSTTMTLIAKKNKVKDIKNHIKKCEQKYPNIYKNESIKRLSKIQKSFIILAKRKLVFLLKILVFLKQIIKKII